MTAYTVKILKTEYVTHDVKRFRVEKPSGYKYLPGQATEITINGRENEVGKGPFTFTSLNEKEYLEFTIKIYQTGKLTKELGKLKVGDELIIHDVWGTITYQEPGVFFAGGAGVTPFIAIFRQLFKDGKIDDNKLILSNKTDEDIILRDEFEKMLGKNFINILTQQKIDKYYSQRIDKELIKKLVNNFNQHFYICGPDKFVEDIHKALNYLKVPEELIVIEK